MAMVGIWCTSNSGRNARRGDNLWSANLMATELLLEPRCPNCDRLTVDNKQHCPEKSSARWAESCHWIKCVGIKDGRLCKQVYGPKGWKGFRTWPLRHRWIWLRLVYAMPQHRVRYSTHLRQLAFGIGTSLSYTLTELPIGTFGSKSSLLVEETIRVEESVQTKH
jgi:hypothetical protein